MTDWKHPLPGRGSSVSAMPGQFTARHYQVRRPRRTRLPQGRKRHFIQAGPACGADIPSLLSCSAMIKAGAPENCATAMDIGRNEPGSEYG